MKLLIYLCRTACTLCIALTAIIGAYAISNDSGHTALPFAPVAVLLRLLAGFAGALPLLLVSSSSRIAWTTILAALGGICFVKLLPELQILVPYDSWAQSGLTEPTTHKNAIVVVLLMILLVIVVWFPGKLGRKAG